MPHFARILAGLCLLAALLPAARTARAAQSYDNCAGTISSLPAVITTQGVWCMKADLTTNIASGSAITINANNVTIDCNDFKLGGLAAGATSVSYGIYANNRQNATVRNCNIRGFFVGINLAGSGHLIEDNRLDNNLYTGISTLGDNIVIRRNRVYDTGDAAQYDSSTGIDADGDLLDNTVTGLFADKSNGILTGIAAYSSGAVISGNKVSGFDTAAGQGGSAASIVGIDLQSTHQRVTGNQVDGGTATIGTGIDATAASYCIENTIGGFATALDVNCTGSGNLTTP